jgi:hypothetical protein
VLDSPVVVLPVEVVRPALVKQNVNGKDSPPPMVQQLQSDLREELEGTNANTVTSWGNMLSSQKPPTSPQIEIPVFWNLKKKTDHGRLTERRP